MPANIYLYSGNQNCITHDITNGKYGTPSRGQSYAGWCRGSDKFNPCLCTGIHVYCNHPHNAVGIRKVSIAFYSFDSNGNIIEEDWQARTFDLTCDDPACGWFEQGDHIFGNDAYGDDDHERCG